ncbi:MAG: S41 family peptidase [Cyanobacteria bacterium P01_D01_bin.73]
MADSNLTSPRCKRSRLPAGSGKGSFSRQDIASRWGQLALGVLAVAAIAPPSIQAARAEFQDSPKAVLDEAWQIVRNEYVDGSFNQNDWDAVRQDLLSREYTSPEQAYAALSEALEKLEDPYTRFLAPDKFKQLKEQTNGSLSGIGIRLRQTKGEEGFTVQDPLPDSPAFKAGLQPGDLILAIDGNSTKGMKSRKASSLIRGEAGTIVELTIQRSEGDPFQVSVTRARIELPIVRSQVNQEGDLKVGYIRLNEFSATASSQMQEAIKELEAAEVDSYVLDLRANPGGLLRASIEIARMWLDKGNIVSTTDRAGERRSERATETALTDAPMVVLVDKDSASASEILTGALQDNQRAVVLGTKTFGKALVQSVHELSDGSGLAVTVARYFTPSGVDINETGIEPDVNVPLTPEQRYYLLANRSVPGSGQDLQYNRAVGLLRAEVAANNSVPDLNF